LPLCRNIPSNYLFPSKIVFSAWNAFRFANLCLKNGDDVILFLNAHVVAYHEVDSPKYKLEEQLKSFALSNGVILV
jgi:hypothetical protein